MPSLSPSPSSSTLTPTPLSSHPHPQGLDVEDYISDDDEAYPKDLAPNTHILDQIVGERMHGEQKMYVVKFKGWSKLYEEPAEHLHQHHIDMYEVRIHVSIVVEVVVLVRW